MVISSNKIKKRSDKTYKFGSIYCTGTSGNIDSINRLYKVLYDPKQYKHLFIPNYWNTYEF